MEKRYLSKYSGSPSVVMGFHGCTQEVAEQVINHGEHLSSSNNDYDWLGPGIYFWESNPLRALEWAQKKYAESGKTPAVVGAFIDLGHCLNLLNSEGLIELRDAYEFLKYFSRDTGQAIPANTVGENGFDLLNRRLDCAVVRAAHQIREMENELPYDTVRGVFWEGQDLYENAGFKEKNHIQISVLNPSAILGYFRPLYQP